MKLLMRAAKDPLVPVGPADTIRHDTIGHNSGNLLFAAATHALLSTKNTQVDTMSSFKGPDLAERVNEEYDGVVIPLANCFRPAFKRELENLTSFINKLTIPFAMLSGGAQVEHGDPTFKSLDSISESVKDFGRAVLNKSDTITVRGHATAEYLAHLGLNDVKIIGCPSLTRMGPNFQVDTAPNRYGCNIAYNVETSKDLMGEVISMLESSGANLTYIPQDIKTLEALFWCRETYSPGRDSSQPLYLTHPHFQAAKVKFFLDADPWIHAMREFDMAIGPRIHGAVSAISAGTPALLVAHDLRTEELSSFHGIPHIKPSELQQISSPSDLWQKLDYTEFNRRRFNQVEAVVAHLETNGFLTTLSEGRQQDRDLYFKRVSAVPYPPPVSSHDFNLNDARFAELRRKAVSLTDQVRDLDKRIKTIEKLETNDRE